MRRFTLLVLVALFATMLVPATAQALTYHRATHFSTTYVKRVIKQEARRAHLNAANTSALMWLGRRESTYKATASNGGRCLGVFQLSRSMIHGHQWFNPRWNTRRAIRYMRGRYGSPAAAKSFWLNHSWY